MALAQPAWGDIACINRLGSSKLDCRPSWPTQPDRNAIHTGACSDGRHSAEPTPASERLLDGRSVVEGRRAGLSAATPRPKPVLEAPLTPYPRVAFRGCRSMSPPT